MSDLGEPPPIPELKRFPRRTISPGRKIYRLHHHELGPFWFGSVPPRGGNRFDLPTPRGSAYWAFDKASAALETLARRPVRLIPAEILARYALTTATVPQPIVDAANLTVKAAKGFGVTAEIHTSADRALTQRWAAALHAAGFRAVLGMPRHDPTGTGRTFTMWGRAGEHRPYGWNWRFTSNSTEELGDLLRPWGVHVVPIPFDVETVTPGPR